MNLECRMLRRINRIANLMVAWTRHCPSPQHGNAMSYCMTDNWDKGYPKLLFPDKVLQVGILDALVNRLKELGFYASLDIQPYEGGLHMHMRLAPINRAA